MNSRQVHEGPLIYTQKIFNFARFFGFLKSADKELAAALQITAHHVAEDIKEPWYLSIRIAGLSGNLQHFSFLLTEYIFF